MKRFQRILAAMLALCLLAGIVPVISQPVQAEETETNVVDVTLYVGQMTTLTDSTGAYDDFVASGSSTTVSLESGVAYELGDAVTSLDTQKKYYIQNTRSSDMLTGVQHTSGGMVTEGRPSDLPENALWQIAFNGEKYALFQEAGKHLVMTSGGASLTGTEYNLYLEYKTEDYWHIRDGVNGLNDHNQVRAAGYGTLDAGSRWIFYEAIEIGGSTDITFSGIAPGVSQVKVGDTVYNVTVLEHPETPNTGSTPIVNKTGATQSVPVTSLTISQGMSFDLDIAEYVAEGDTATWTMEDPQYATVSDDGTVTGVAAGETVLVVTVNEIQYRIPVTVLPFTSGSYTVMFDFYIRKAINTNVYYSLSGSSDLVLADQGSYIYIQVDTTSAATAMDFFGAPELGYVLNKMGSTNGVNYQAIDSDDPAQTKFYTTYNTAGYNQAADDVFGPAKVLEMIQSAIDKDCEGGMGYTVFAKASKTLSAALEFVSERLPTMEKDVVGILGTGGTAADYRPYEPGMTAKVGETVWFRIRVTNYLTESDPITYTNAVLTDVLPGGEMRVLNEQTGIWTDIDPDAAVDEATGMITKDITADLNTAITKDTVYRYIVAYTITADDLDTTITNTAALTYNYQSTYNSASFSLEATANANITATEFPPKHIVVDFGLPTTVYFENWGAGKQFTSWSAASDAETGKQAVDVQTVYEDGSIKGWNVTYTPWQILQETDIVTLVAASEDDAAAQTENPKQTLYYLYVFPASTVYYEEGFASYTGFTGGGMGSGSQTGSFVGDRAYYGYDVTYAGQAAGPSGGSEAVSEAKGSTASFTFTGTGVDIYANCTTGTGLINVVIRNDEGRVVKFYQVDTVTGGGSPITTPQSQLTNAYSLPVVSVLGLYRDTYTVTITHAVRNLNDGAGQIKIDGFRVYGTLAADSEPYTLDGEANPQYIELRDELLTTVGVTGTSNSDYKPKDAGTIVDQVFETANSLTGVVYLGNSDAWDESSVRDLLDNGPKNELYLYEQNDTLVFNVVPKGSYIQLGMKTVDAATGYKITIDGTEYTGAITSGTEMFYRFPVTKGQENTVTITNTGNGFLSVTKLKTTDDAAAQEEAQATALVALTADDMVLALSAMGIQEVAEPESPFTDIEEGKYYYDAVLWAVENGITQGTSETTFEPDTICTRGQIVTFLWRMAGSPEPASLESPFVDVNVNNRFIKAIMWAVERGVTKGTGDGTTFEPDKECTRGQIVMFLWRYYGSPEPECLENPFTDVSEHNTFFKPILWAYYEDITKGKTQTTFDSGDPCTRGQAVTFLYRSRAEE